MPVKPGRARESRTGRTHQAPDPRLAALARLLARHAVRKMLDNECDRALIPNLDSALLKDSASKDKS